MTADITLHDDQARAAITAELVRLTIGARGPVRPELNVTVSARLAQMAREWTAVKVSIGEVMLPVVRRMTTAINDALGGAA